MLFGIVLSAVFTFTSCNDDDDEEPVKETLAGIYQMDEAILTTDIKDVDDVVVVPSGTDVTAIMASGIFGASPCEDQANSAIDMREDGKLYFNCIGAESGVTPTDAGSWSENSSLTVLTLSLSAAVVPPAGFQLTITSVSKNGTVINGTIPSVPVTAELLNAAFPDATFDPIVIVGADVEFSEAQ
jgi:hypothetical protein